ncbi:YwmB family TATA-box binding protein [Alkalihalobacillus sp. MEB130]|uniref:YwmB family TATA-box binding protein n=1 Tax=Alkalihalobacillus sp. MEB130 TaxID=2976704 RepID=UPI0028DE88C8|nr:YwmB family TATA-box binding protein [Alkalihalobacillus sp. MEB130]MDT8858682.1 YwmB family TATA-box binding protein [Alkalihalobacillus sp. MEB130]
MIKNIILYSTILSLMFGLYTFQSVSGDTIKENKLEDMMAVADKKEIAINSWIVYSKHEMKMAKDHETVDKYIVEMINEKSEFQWAEEEVRDNEYRKVVGTKKNLEMKTDERFVLTAHESMGQQMINITHQITGVDWNDEISNIITEQTQGNDNYATVKATVPRNGQDLENLATNFVEDFAGEVKEGIIEDHFVSLSAYTNQWESGIEINATEQINLQIGVRDIGEAGTVELTIGTPIITAEY